jgi:hypothetical protein
MSQGNRRFKVSAEVIVEVTDEAALEHLVLEQVDSAEFPVATGASLADVRAQVRQDAQGDLAGAVAWISNADAIIPDIPGVRIVHSTHTVVEADTDDLELMTEPDFAELFPPCRCGKDDCDVCSGFQVTPRTAAVLWTIAQILADRAYDDVDMHGDEPLSGAGGCWLFGDYPRVTWRQDAVWRRQAARAFDDLAEDIEAGKWPQSTCPGEEMALHLMLRSAKDAVEDGWGPPPEMLAQLPEHADDYDWRMADEVLLEDDDILNLFDARLDGVEDPEADYNRFVGMGDYRPEAWFRPFLDATPRDGRRGFRR